MRVYENGGKDRSFCTDSVGEPMVIDPLPTPSFRVRLAERCKGEDAEADESTSTHSAIPPCKAKPLLSRAFAQERRTVIRFIDGLAPYYKYTIRAYRCQAQMRLWRRAVGAVSRVRTGREVIGLCVALWGRGWYPWLSGVASRGIMLGNPKRVEIST